jgi:phosphopantothenoylcysteine decarboxylase/phosphopantothenate--cysteine ligase
LILVSVGPAPGALKAPEICAELQDSGHEVQVVLEPHATVFVGPAAFEGRAVEKPTARPQALLFAPATPATLAKLARGMSGSPALDLWLETIRPAVAALDADADTAAHPAVLQNVRDVRGAGCRVLMGEDGAMVSSLEAANAVLGGLGGPLSGLRVLVTAGGTREPIDRVRVVSNRSSGKMGRAVAREAVRLGADVTVVAANVEEWEPGVRWVPVETYAELEEATLRLAREADALVMAAAVSDFTPAQVEEGKIRRGGKKEMDLKLVATGDVLKAVRGSSPGLFVVGFAATFGDPVDDAREKLESKGADLMVGNDISLSGSGFGSNENEVHVVGKGGGRFVPRASKREVAREILDAMAREIGDKER